MTVLDSRAGDLRVHLLLDVLSLAALAALHHFGSANATEALCRIARDDSRDASERTAARRALARGWRGARGRA